MKRNPANLFFIPKDHNTQQSYVEIIMSSLGGFIQTTERYYGVLYRVHDWVHVLSESNSHDRRQAWYELKQVLLQHRVIYSIEFETVEQKDPDGTIHDSDFCSQEMLYFITQHMDFNDSVTAVRNYLAKAGVFVDSIRRNPEIGYETTREAYRMQGKDELWIDTRVEGMIHRKNFMEVLRLVVRIPLNSRDYGTATDYLYIGLWKRTKDILLEQMNLPKNANLRDNQSRLALLLESVAEEMCLAHLGDKKELNWWMARAIIQDIASKIGKYVEEIGRDLGKDIATNIPLEPGYELPKLDGSREKIRDWKTPRKIKSQND